MAKRMTDSNKWDDPWFQDLPAKYKLFWLYLLDKCDHAGIWEINFKNACFFIGENLEISEVKRIMSGRVNFLNDKYWIIVKFIDFQYGGIKQDNVGKSIKNILQKHNILDLYEPLISPCQGTKAKAKDKAMVKDKDKVLFYGEKSDLAFSVDRKYITDSFCKVYKSGFKEYIDTHQSGLGFPKSYMEDIFWREYNGKMFNDHKHVNQVMLNIRNNKNG
jgi:hypothetical protein